MRYEELDIGYREIAKQLGISRMAAWRIRGEEAAPGVGKVEASRELAGYEGVFEVRRDLRSVSEENRVQEFMELVREERDRGVKIRDICEMTGMTRDMLNYRIKHEV